MNVKLIRSVVKQRFASDPFFFWVIWGLMSVNPIASLFNVCDWINVLITITFNYCLACLLTIVLSMTKHTGVILKYFCITAIGLYEVLALFCIIQFHAQLDVTIIETLLATNTNEIKEFLCVFFPWWLIISVIIAFVVIFITHNICTHRCNLKMSDRQVRIHAYLLTYIVIVLLICHEKVIVQMQSYNSWIIPFETIAINLNDYEPKHINLKAIRDSHPQKIVLIIGESHSKGHSSLYGYDKETNPKLRKLVKDSLAIVFTNVESPATATTQSFKYILNTRRVMDYGKEWYLFPSIITIMESAGYKTFWLSNQDEVGLFDNTASCFAHICDRYRFNTKEERLDGNIVGMHVPIKGKEMVIYHLMGQHVDFSKRYPASFKKFTSDDYPNSKCTNKTVLADYDNACLYNDYVVSSIIDIYRNTDALVIYFPDHGLDVFQSSPSYFGHAHGFRKSSRRFGYEIPFIVYTSPIFKHRYPDIVKNIQNSRHEKFCTADFTLKIMRIIGYDFANNKKSTALKN